MKLGGEYIRVSDKEAESYKEKGYEYCPKKEWKINVRDVLRAQQAAEAERKAKIKAEARKNRKK